jgi:hypothetical protein
LTYRDFFSIRAQISKGNKRNMVFKRIAQYIVVGMLLISAVMSAAYAGSAGTSVFPFLKICPSVPNAAAGEISTLVNAQSVLMNPALSPWIKQRQVVLEHMLYLGDSSYSMLGYLHPADKWNTFSITAGMLGMGGFTRTIADASNPDGFSEHGDFGFSDTFVSLGYGHRSSRFFSYGVSLQTVQETIDAKSNTGVMLSAGGFYNNYMKDDWRVSFGVFNLGPQVKGYDLPMGGYLGIGKMINPGLYWGGDAVAYFDRTSALRTGLEYSINDKVFLRAGYRYPMNDHEQGDFPSVDLTAGLGLNINSFTLDYAWLPYGDLGDTHRVALTYRLGK